MRCPECKWPMGLAREEKGIRVWRCEKCKREKRGVTKGEIAMSWSVPVRLQEKAVLVLALLALAMPVRAAQLTAPSGTLINCTTGACQTGCSRDGQTIGSGPTTVSNVTNNGTASTTSGSCCSQVTATCTTGLSPAFDWVVADGATKLDIHVTNDQSNSVTGEIEVSVDGGINWTSVQALSFSGPGTRAYNSVTAPNGRYRYVVNVCGTGTDCHVLAKYKYTNQR